MRKFTTFYKRGKKAISFTLAAACMITTVAPGVSVSAAEQEKSMNPVLSDSVVEEALKHMADENNTLYVDMAGDSNDLLKGITSSIQDSIVNEGLTIANTGIIKNEEEGDVSYIVSASKDSYRPTSLAQSTDNSGENLYLEGQTIKFYANSGDAVPAYDLLGMFNPDLKEDNNLTLSLAHTGTIENPYVIMEYSPNASQSSIRPLIADAGYYSLTYEEVYGGTLNGVTYEGIKLTDEEKLVVRVNLLNRLISQWNSENVANFAENQKKYDEYQTALASYNAIVNAYESLYPGLATMTPAQKEPSFKNGMTTALAAALLDGYKTKIWEIIQEAYNNRTNSWDSIQSIMQGILGYWPSFSTKEEFLAYNPVDSWPGKYGLGDTYYAEYMETVDAAVADAWAIASAKLSAENNVLLTPDEFKNALTEPEEPKLDSKYLNAMDVMTSLKEVDASDRDEVEKVLVKLEKYVVDHDILSESSYEKRLSSAYDSGLNYKIMFEKAQAYGAERDNGVAYPNYDYLYDNARAYSVDNNGNFVYSTDWEFDKYSAGTGGVTDGTGTAKVNMSGGYTMTTSVFDPILTTSQSNAGANATEFYRCSTNQNNGKLLVMDYTFRKSCINLAYKAGKNDAGAVDSLTPYVDEYVFNGWMIDPDGDGENLVNLDTWTGTAEEFAEITSLYTSWYVRYWGENEFKLLTLTNKSDFIPVEFSGEGFQYTVYVPATIASRNSGSYHDARNQLTMCVPVHAKWITTSYNNGGVVVPGFNQTTTYMNYTDEISAWDFDFSREKYSTPESLQNVIPSLMGDTDYHTLFYNAIPTYTESDGRVVVEYQPFNIKVITVDSADLNRLVYYDYMNADGSVKASMYDGDGEPIYQDTDAIRRFINNIDFMYFDGGRGSVYFGNHASVDDTAAIKCFESRDASGKLASDETTVYNNGKRYRKVVEDKCPSLCDSVKNADDQYVLSFNASKIKTGLKYGSDLSSCTDIEWQVAYRMYLRTASGNADTDPNQQYRRMAVIIDEATIGSAVCKIPGVETTYIGEMTADGTLNYYGDGSGSSGMNLFKLMIMYFAFKDPTDLYQYYVLGVFPGTSSIGTGSENIEEQYYFDTFSGVRREENNLTSDVYLGTYFTGDLYGFQRWNLQLFMPTEIYAKDNGVGGMEYVKETELDVPSLTTYAISIAETGSLSLVKKRIEYHRMCLIKNYLDTEGKANSIWGIYDTAGHSASWITYHGNTVHYTNNTPGEWMDDVGLSYHSEFKTIANQYVYTYNGDNSLASAFMNPDIIRIDNRANGLSGPAEAGLSVDPNGYGNTSLAFDYFLKYRPVEIASNGNIATKSAIEFMVQNAQLGYDPAADKFITILNKEGDQVTKETLRQGSVAVDLVISDEIGSPLTTVEFAYNGRSATTYCIAEYYWTPSFKNVDNNEFGKIWYGKYVNSDDARDRWYRMGESSEEANASYYYKTSTDPLFGTEVNNVNSPVAYYVQTQCKPNIKESVIKKDPDTGIDMENYDVANASGATALSNRNLPYYIIVVKEYRNEAEAMRALSGENISPLYCRTKNVTVKRNTDLEIMD